MVQAPHRGEVHAEAMCLGAAHFEPESLTVRRLCAQARQPMTLAAVLRHVLTMDQATVEATRARADALLSRAMSHPAGVFDRYSFAAVLESTGESELRRMNVLVNTALDACLRVDTARQQLQNAISIQRDIETVLEMIAARVEVGQASQVDHRRVTSQLTSACDKVTHAVAEWNRLGRRFTQITRLLPAQLEAVVDVLGPIPADEMDRLAEASLCTQGDVPVSQRHRARAWALRRTGSPEKNDPGPERSTAWVSRLEQSRHQAAADFAAAREAYLQSTLTLDLEHACFVRARSLRRTAETGFRHGSRSALHFAEAILEEGQRMHSVLNLQADSLSAKHQLFALAGLLLKQFGLVEPEAAH